MRSSLDDGPSALCGFFGIGEGGAVFHKDPGAHEDGLSSKLHNERAVGGRGDALAYPSARSYVPAPEAAGLWEVIGATRLLKCLASGESVSSSPTNP